MIYKVSELEDALLDAAVAKAEGRLVTGEAIYVAELNLCKWSIDWALGGPIIERERISVFRIRNAFGAEAEWWTAGFDPSIDEGSQCESGWTELPALELENEQIGSTALIAAMRAYVASKLGDEIDL